MGLDSVSPDPGLQQASDTVIFFFLGLLLARSCCSAPRPARLADRTPQTANRPRPCRERVCVGESFGVATENDSDVAQVAVDADAVFGGDHEIRGGRTFFLPAVPGIGADVDDFLGVAQQILKPSRFRIKNSSGPDGTRFLRVSDTFLFCFLFFFFAAPIVPYTSLKTGTRQSRESIVR